MSGKRQVYDWTGALGTDIDVSTCQFFRVLSAAVRDGSGIVALGSGPSTAIQWRKPVHGTTRAIVEVCFEYG